MKDVIRNFIAGRWMASRSGEMFKTINPATRETLAVCTASDAHDVDVAVEAASSDLVAWGKLPAPRRAEFLYRAAELLKKRKETLAKTITQEMGKVLMEARGDVQEAIDMAYYMAGEGRRMFGHTVPSELPDKFCMSIRDPVGGVAVITPWNFPIAVPSWKILPALVLGNTVVWKPSNETPLCAAQCVEVFADVGLPDGVLNLVLGKGGEALVRHREVRLVTFTGSNEVGQRVAKQAAARGKRCALEMGGKNAILVMEDADLTLAVEGIIWSAFGTSGQRCTAASRVIAHRAVSRELAELLVERIKRLKIGNGLDPATEVGPVVNEDSLKKIDRYVHVGVEEGARLLMGGEPYRKGACSKGFFYRPTLFDRVKPKTRIAREEIFGPVTCLIEADNLDQAIAINNDVPFGLVSSIYRRDVNPAFAEMRGVL